MGILTPADNDIEFREELLPLADLKAQGRPGRFLRLFTDFVKVLSWPVGQSPTGPRWMQMDATGAIKVSQSAGGTNEVDLASLGGTALAAGGPIPVAGAAMAPGYQTYVGPLAAAEVVVRLAAFNTPPKLYGWQYQVWFGNVSLPSNTFCGVQVWLRGSNTFKGFMLGDRVLVGNAANGASVWEAHADVMLPTPLDLHSFFPSDSQIQLVSAASVANITNVSAVLFVA